MNRSEQTGNGQGNEETRNQQGSFEFRVGGTTVRVIINLRDGIIGIEASGSFGSPSSNSSPDSSGEESAPDPSDTLDGIIISRPNYPQLPPPSNPSDNPDSDQDIENIVREVGRDGRLSIFLLSLLGGMAICVCLLTGDFVSRFLSNNEQNSASSIFYHGEAPGEAGGLGLNNWLSGTIEDQQGSNIIYGIESSIRDSNPTPSVSPSPSSTPNSSSARYPIGSNCVLIGVNSRAGEIWQRMGRPPEVHFMLSNGEKILTAYDGRIETGDGGEIITGRLDGEPEISGAMSRLGKEIREGKIIYACPSRK